MKKLFSLLAVATIVIFGLTSCESKTFCQIKWGVANAHITDPSAAKVENQLLDSVFDAEFSKASFGEPRSGEHHITVNGIRQRDVKKIKEEAKTLANNANAALAGKTFQNSYTYEVWAMDSKNSTISESDFSSTTETSIQTETIASFNYGSAK